MNSAFLWNNTISENISYAKDCKDLFELQSNPLLQESQLDFAAIEFDKIKKMGRFYSFEKLNELGEPIYYASLNQKIILRVNLTGDSFENVSIGFELPTDYIKKVQDVDWHTEKVNITGGWVYNSTSGTYEWDPNATVTTYKWVFGPCTKEIYVWRTIEVNTTMWKLY